ncbi:hypothetical protein [Bacillus cereus]|uniref:Uncharacterized protein n=1 Tax=Bacillus cereus MC67 TaxID=1053219 RepID=J8EWV4_BACCE|nr:hypothetical protein [Bacillus cereus]EJQ92965.1 hypothetical protein II3_05419 [Bacillus cereus MC67]EOO99749.1 hypothetical protein II1_05315 [Bacillus cereus MC118]
MEKTEKILSSPVTSFIYLIIIFGFVINWGDLTKTDYVLMGTTIFYVLATLFCLLSEVIKKQVSKW